MDTIFIEQLAIETTIGIYDWEQSVKQLLLIDIDIAWDNRKSAKSDNILETLNYADVAMMVTQYVERNKFFLIERVAEEIAELLLTRFKLSKIKIKVCKPGAVVNARQVGVSIERKSS